MSLRLAAALVLAAALPAAAATPRILPELREALVCAYDFEHPDAGDPALERPLGVSEIPIHLIGAPPDAMRAPDAARPGLSLRTRAARDGAPAWKAGIHRDGGVPGLARFRAVSGITLMGWVKSAAPALAPAAKSSGGRHAGVCLFGLLHGASDGHHVRALVEFIRVDGSLRLVALGRRRDDGPALVLAASAAPDAILPPDTWVHLAATFDYARGVCALYRDGRPLDTLPLPAGDPWALASEPAPASCSDTIPAGIKIGGSHPQDLRERNPFDGLFDDLMFFDRALAPDEVLRQYNHTRAAD